MRCRLKRADGPQASPSALPTVTCAIFRLRAMARVLTPAHGAAASPLILYAWTTPRSPPRCPPEQSGESYGGRLSRVTQLRGSDLMHRSRAHRNSDQLPAGMTGHFASESVTFGPESALGLVFGCGCALERRCGACGQSPLPVESRGTRCFPNSPGSSDQSPSPRRASMEPWTASSASSASMRTRHWPHWLSDCDSGGGSRRRGTPT